MARVIFLPAPCAERRTAYEHGDAGAGGDLLKSFGILKLRIRRFATSSVRSSVSSRKEDLRDRLEHIAEFLGGEIAVSGDYPAWEYQAKSEIRGYHQCRI